MGKFLTASGSTKDLTSVSVNPNVPAVTTPRAGGFTLRNRVSFSNLNSSGNVFAYQTSSSSSNADANTFKLLDVPKRTIIRQLSFHAVPGSSAPVGAWGSGSSGSAKLNVGALMYKSASQASTKASTGAFLSSGSIASGGNPSTMPTVSASTPWTQGQLVASSSNADAVFFPWGGWVTMNIKNSTGGSTASSLSSGTTLSSFSGMLEIRASGDYMPE